MRVLESELWALNAVLISQLVHTQSKRVHNDKGDHITTLRRKVVKLPNGEIVQVSHVLTDKVAMNSAGRKWGKVCIPI